MKKTKIENHEFARVGIVGVSGYSGGLALELLLKHPFFRLTYVSANNTTGPITDIWPKLRGCTNLHCDRYDLKQAAELCDFVFLAVPHTIAMRLVPDLLKKNIRVIDLSGDYRLDSSEQYKMWYKAEHEDLKHLDAAVYGLPELYKEDIRKAHLIANPGCYPTAAILGLAPIYGLENIKPASVMIDAKSGISGAGRKAKLPWILSELEGNFYPYKPFSHQHNPEIDLYLSRLKGDEVHVDFVPHLLPIRKGILESIYVRFDDPVDIDEIYQEYQRFYKLEPFVRLLPLGEMPQLRDVVDSNFCDISLSLNQDGRCLMITSAIDNLFKGASGQAVQNLNLMAGRPETEGLWSA